MSAPNCLRKYFTFPSSDSCDLDGSGLYISQGPLLRGSSNNFCPLGISGITCPLSFSLPTSLGFFSLGLRSNRRYSWYSSTSLLAKSSGTSAKDTHTTFESCLSLSNDCADDHESFSKIRDPFGLVGNSLVEE